MPFNHVLYEPPALPQKAARKPQAKRKPNKGSLQKGHQFNSRPIGSIRKRVGLMEIKTQTGWVRLARFIWESHHGPIPKEMVVWHIDGNNENNNPENLELINRGEISRRTSEKRKATLREKCRRDYFRKTMDLKTILNYVKPRIGETRSVTINGSVDRRHKRILDEMAKERNVSRSEIVREAVIDYLKKHQKITT